LIATETFYKTIYIDDKAADVLIAGFERPCKPHIPKFDIDENMRRGEDLLRTVLYRLEKSLTLGEDEVRVWKKEN